MAAWRSLSDENEVVLARCRAIPAYKHEPEVVREERREEWERLRDEWERADARKEGA